MGLEAAGYASHEMLSMLCSVSLPSEEPGTWQLLFDHSCAFGSSKLCGSIAWSLMQIDGEGGGGSERDGAVSSAQQRSVMYVTGEGGVHAFVWEELEESDDSRVRLCGQKLVDAGGRAQVARGVVALSHGGLAAASFDGTLMMRAPSVGPPLLKPVEGTQATIEGDEVGSSPTDVLATLLSGGRLGAQTGIFKTSGGGPLISVIGDDTPSGRQEQETEGSVAPTKTTVSADVPWDLGRRGTHGSLASSVGCLDSSGARNAAPSSACAQLVLFKVRMEQGPGVEERMLVDLVSSREIEGVVVPDVLCLLAAPVLDSSPQSGASHRREKSAGNVKVGRKDAIGGGCVAGGIGCQRLPV